ncbi:Copper transporter like [Actinidia chinensis var. chinensis]|uniref:Copper transport protein n=1 Tax=Actinidia chinensis var. chinensis TaxID=1590841 RepID=A0A2R6QUP3_ACTCC|nr:Copper transporter like [Actinidia chinensis var. chinensis]
MMRITMYWGKDVTLLFDWWRTDSWPSYALSLLACFLFSLFYQYLEDRRLRFNSTAADRLSQPLLSKIGRTRGLAAAALFGFNAAIGYLLMLAIMSFNGGVFLAIVFGISVGYFLFRAGDDDDGHAVIVDNSCGCS